MLGKQAPVEDALMTALVGKGSKTSLHQARTLR